MRRFCSAALFCILGILLFGGNAIAQSKNNYFQKQEDTLVKYAHAMLRKPLPNQKMDNGLKFAKILYATLQETGSYNYNFDSLDAIIRIIRPKDGSFRIFNWIVRPDRHVIRYYGIIQTKDRVYPLTNYSRRLLSNNNSFLFDSLNRKHWFGAEYYKIMKKRVNKTNYYFLFGFNYDGTYSNKKILDVLHFNADGPIFGAPLFEYPSDKKGGQKTPYRLLWQYQKQAHFSLRFDDKRNVIAFDHLRSKINNPLKKNTYVPTGRIDGLEWKDGKWRFKKKIIKPLILKDGQAPVNGVIQKPNSN